MQVSEVHHHEYRSPSSLYVGSGIAFIFLTLIRLLSDVEDEFWGIDFRFEDFADLILRLDYFTEIPTLLGLGLDSLIAVEEMLSLCFTIGPQQEKNTSRC